MIHTVSCVLNKLDQVYGCHGSYEFLSHLRLQAQRRHIEVPQNYQSGKLYHQLRHGIKEPKQGYCHAAGREGGKQQVSTRKSSSASNKLISPLRHSEFLGLSMKMR